VLKGIKVKAVEQDEFSFVEMASGAKQKFGGKVTGCSLNLGEFVTRANLYVMILGYYDVVISMDWLESHEVILNYKTKWLSLVDDEGQRHVIIGQNQGVSLRFISSLQLRKSMCKGCNIYVILALNKKGVAEGLEHLLVVREFVNVFPEELLGMPPREGIGIFHRPKTEDWTDKKNALSDVDPRVTRVENATEGVVGPGTYMSKCFTMGCINYLHMEEGWVVETLHWLSSIEQSNDQELILVAKDWWSVRSDEGHDGVFKDELRSGYHQLRIKEDDFPKIAFKMRFGHYEFIILPFGLTNSLGVFMNLMNGVFHEYLDKLIQVFIDGILSYSCMMEEHDEHLRLVLQCLWENKLYGKLFKCLFYQLKIHYLGHIISNEGIIVDPVKVEAIMEWPASTNVFRSV
jgi:hypothetical protein